ncbi:hypothetical protein C8F01DRAFT_1119842 [Mycena amicta]|nr:hypothetical protein C8F01DRAFT_1119842 [Mycena amicta]
MDDLFLERLDTFCTSTIRTFAERENRSFDDTRQLVAEWHSRLLFSPQHSSSQDRTAQIKSILSDTSRILESLWSTVGVESFVLAVDPSDAKDPGFLGGSGGGEAGAKAFKSHCVKMTVPETSSGVGNAEMKWTNPSLLDVYGVCLVGWPPSIPAQNPSSLKAEHNKQLLEALENGTMHFARILSSTHGREPPPAPPEDDSFAWAIQYDDVRE